MKRITLPVLALPLLAVVSLLLTACPAGPGGEARSVAADAAQVPVTESRAGTQQHVVLESKVDGVDISFEMFEPDQIEAGKTYPLVLNGHGYAGTRQETRTGFIARLTAAGYYAISIDQRGFGQAGGTVRSMSPDFEGRDLVQILDWAESLPGLARRPDGSMRVGSYGGSYGGMYQLAIAGVDSKRRLRVLAPDITPHDLVYALAPNNVVKSGWGLVLIGGGEAGAQGNNGATGQPRDFDPRGGQDPVLWESLVQATMTNSFSEASLNMFRYHSVRYFCDGVAPGPQEFTFATGDPMLVPPAPFGKIDVLLTQGFRDTLFNFNDGYNNYECLKRGGGDVRLLTHQSGHILPAFFNGAGDVPQDMEDALDPFYAALTIPEIQDIGGSRACGKVSLDDAQFAWFEEKLQGKFGAANAVIKSGQNVCISLAEGDAVAVRSVKIGGQAFNSGADLPQFNAVLGVGGAVLGNGAREALLATLPLYTVPAGGAILAGLPTMSLQLTGLSGQEPQSCAAPVAAAACDPILYLAIGHRKAGMERWDIVDDQLTPLRGFGAHQDRMSGIAERLAEGDELALLIYGFHAQFPVTWSRDILVPALNVSGSLSLPFLSASEIVQSGV